MLSRRFPTAFSEVWRRTPPANRAASPARSVATLFPEKMPLYDMVYESRFRRLRQQFRERP